MSFKKQLHHILEGLKQQWTYFSIATIKSGLDSSKIAVSNDLLHEYLSEAAKKGIINHAGRGWYTRLQDPAKLNPELVKDLDTLLKKRFPLLPYYLWSTQQFNPWMHHLLGKGVVFAYVDADGQDDVVDHLRDEGWDVTLNPTKKAAKNFVVRDRSVVVRGISREIEGTTPSIETALVDLFMENERLQLMDQSEFQSMAETLLSQQCVDVARLQRLLGDRKRKWTQFLKKETTQYLGII